jgi:hypothetical protein
VCAGGEAARRRAASREAARSHGVAQIRHGPLVGKAGSAGRRTTRTIARQPFCWSLLARAILKSCEL